MNIVCPLDGGSLVENGSGLHCALCHTSFPLTPVGANAVRDFRCPDRKTTVDVRFTIPVEVLPRSGIQQFGKATEADFTCMSREEIRAKFGTKLQKEIIYYIDQLLKTVGPGARILDLGCGTGGTKRYLQSLGFTNILAVDYFSSGAEYLVDAHRMPFEDNTFDMIITTAIIDAFYNQYIAFREMSRVLKSGGALIASGSFWEEWHSSCFHCTPSGLNVLCEFAGMDLEDMWSSWGFIPSMASHALGLSKYKKHTYRIQRLFDYLYRRKHGPEALKLHSFRTSGGFGIHARKR